MKNILDNIDKIDAKNVFKKSMEHEINGAKTTIESIPNLPLFFNKQEMIQIDKYYKYLSIENQ